MEPKASLTEIKRSVFAKTRSEPILFRMFFYLLPDINVDVRFGSE